MKFALVIFTLLLLSCTNNRLAKDVYGFMGQEITLSMDWEAVWRGKDTVLTGFAEAPVKLVVWYDSLLCGSCEVVNISAWSSIVTEADSLLPHFKIVYLFTPKRDDFRSVNIALKADKLDYPVFIDQRGGFVKQNPKLPKNRRLHTFLLDRNNKVVMMGSPLHNPFLWDLYKKTIRQMIANDGILPANEP